mmetsp:Transcript_12208/g.25759  ORF Transcript_12208/g.25759 Transcript_12208/m.25759 type:complete len:174 (-) Transcript_12208:1169-1690(-)
MRLPQLRDDLNGFQPRILRESIGNHFQGVGIGLKTVRIHPGRFECQFAKSEGGLRLRRSSSGDYESFLDQGAYDALSIVNGSICLGEDELVRSSKKDRGSFAGIGDSCEFDDLVSRSGKDDVPDVGGGAEFFGCERVDVGDGCASEGAAHEFYVGAFHVGDDEDVHFCEEVEG